MKRILTATVLVALSSAACAEGYAGAVFALSRIGFACDEGATCDLKSHGLKFYGGSKLDSARSVDLGIGKIDAVEVSYLKFGDVRATATSTDGLSTVTKTGQADALVIAAVAHVPVVDQLSLVGRLGAAYVSSTFKTSVDGLSRGGQTQNKLKPYVGLGFEYDIPQIVKIVGSIDATRFQNSGQTATARWIGLGAETSF